jgi:hypothetical protein
MRKLQDTSDGEVSFPIRYYSVQPNKWTFQCDKIRREVEAQLEGRVLNACAGKTKLNHEGEIIRNDLNEERDADLHVDVNEIAEHFEPNSFDVVIHDPPFSKKQAESTYDGLSPVDEGNAMEQYDQLLKPGGKVIKFGFSTTCMPGQKDYVRTLVCIFNTLGRMNDWLMTVDMRMSGDLRQWNGENP